MSFRLDRFDLTEMLRCGREVRDAAGDATSYEASARNIVHYFYHAFRDENAERACVLARLYKTHRYGDLPPTLKEQAKKGAEGFAPLPNLVCLTLMATAGDRFEWNDRSRSRGHQAIPLASTEIVERAPMIAQLIREMGLDLPSLVRTDVVLPLEERRTYGVFHVEEAVGSPYIPAQVEFVEPYRVRSVLGFGGVLKGDLFAVILFTKAPISRPTAERFRRIALDVKSALFGASARIFD